MNRFRTHCLLVMTALFLALGARTARGTTIQELVRLKGHERNVLTGMGLVVGLDGTGDTAKNAMIAARPFAQLLTNFGNPVEDVSELLRADAFAIVAVTMQIPPTGAREGDRFDVFVDKMFNAESLQGGRLITSMLRPPGPDSPDIVPMAYAEGPLVLEGGDFASARIRGGGQMLVDIRTNPVRGGSVTLIVDEQYAGYPVAATIASAVNEEFAIDGYRQLAVVEDAQNVRVLVPPADRPQPAAFLAALLTIPIDPSLLRTKARIVVNEKAGIITVNADVEIGPVAVSHNGLQLTTIAPPATPAAPGGGAAGAPGPPAGSGRWVGVDTTNGLGRRSTRLADLLAAFDQLNVPTQDQIAILYELQRTGALYAEIVGQ